MTAPEPTLAAAVEALADQWEHGARPVHWRGFVSDLRRTLAARTEPDEGAVERVLAQHELVGKSVPAGDHHECRLITTPHDGCGCTRIVIGCTGCDWVTEADGTQGDAFNAHVAAALRAAGVLR